MALETVLVALGTGDEDRVDRIVETVVDVAGPANAKVVLAHVFTDDEFDETANKLDFDAGTAGPDDVAGRYTLVRDVEERLTEAGLDVEIRGAVGEKGEQIVDLAESTSADLLVVGGRRRSPTGKAVFGSTAQRIMLDAPCPVTFVRSE